MSRHIRIDPLTRLEGHGRIEIFLDEEGNVDNAYFQVPELRGFERFCVGRGAEDMPNITNRICGICPEAHHMAASKALDEMFRVKPSRTAVLLRELVYCAFFITDHATHFYALGGPDFLVGPDAPPEQRNLLGLVRKLGVEIGGDVIACRARNHEIIKMLGGRPIHPAAGLPGGWSMALSPERRDEMQRFARENIQFGLRSLGYFHSPGSGQSGKRGDDLRRYVPARHVFNRDGGCAEPAQLLRRPVAGGGSGGEGSGAVRGAGLPRAHRRASGELDLPEVPLSEGDRVEGPGGRDGQTGVYTSSPLARLNVSDSVATPLANEEYERLYAAFGRVRRDGRFAPIHHRLATHWARLVELLYASERMLEIVLDPEVTDPNVRQVVETRGGEGIGCVEAPRGTLIHHYQADDRGVLTKVNLIVGTTHNNAAMAMSIKKAASTLIQKGRVIEQGLLNRIEMAFRLYDPCLSCATHSLPGQMPLEVNIRKAGGETDPEAEPGNRGMKTVVIGIGNPFRGDDAAGMAAVDLIEHQLPAAVDVVCKRVDSGGLGLMEEMAGFDLAILIDACAEGDAPGTIHRRDANQWTESCNTSSSHDGSLADAIEIGKLGGSAAAGGVAGVGYRAGVDGRVRRSADRAGTAGDRTGEPRGDRTDPGRAGGGTAHMNTTVFFCRCGDNVAAQVDGERVAAAFDGGTTRCVGVDFLCSEEGKQFMREELAAHPGRVVAAACSPRDHESTFQGVTERIGV